ncbi:ATP synthase [Burkholderia cepacia]|uniref:ATP synthase n=1 Tax=Burkholderia cepacia TaxID=292 RepID=A0A0J5VZC9_BURCE|nr:type III secretion system ATPase SctN [Burkholderia cepacia]KML40105.1 ATP synthase [Burkholderia cepacia]
MTTPTLLRRGAHLVSQHGSIIEASLQGVAVGEVCELRASPDMTEICGRAQVVGFKEDRTVLSLMGSPQGLSRATVIMPTGAGLTARIGDHLAGCVVNAAGDVVERLAGESGLMASEARSVDTAPPVYSERLPVETPLNTGIRAIDGLLTCGLGQRLGIFAAAGCGKTSLMSMLINHGEADLFVIGLIGERGREVTEFVTHLRKSGSGARCVLVYATSDQAPVDRCNAALLATTVAEYFRSQGDNVVLFIDSMTRYARALRDVALAAGEMPARRGYPASVFDALPRILERPGLTRQGSISAFYTVLLESEDEVDPIGEEIKSILDGHIYLSRKLAARNHYPAIDVLRSASRVAGSVMSAEQQELVGQIRTVLSRLEGLQVYVDLGEYHRGENPDNDRIMQLQEPLDVFLRQRADERGVTGARLLEVMSDAIS